MDICIIYYRLHFFSFLLFYVCIILPYSQSKFLNILWLFINIVNKIIYSKSCIIYNYSSLFLIPIIKKTYCNYYYLPSAGLPDAIALSTRKNLQRTSACLYCCNLLWLLIIGKNRGLLINKNYTTAYITMYFIWSNEWIWIYWDNLKSPTEQGWGRLQLVYRLRSQLQFKKKNMISITYPAKFYDYYLF